jgi:HAD superfamily hydrolase (TIGR01509 family)
MNWSEQFNFFLFDFDGLLVNTEELHFKAYIEMCKRRGYLLEWSLSDFFSHAHFHASGLKEAIYAEFPALYVEEPRWDVLYMEKKIIYQQLLEEGSLQLMPGVESFLEELAQLNLKRCVVTNSPKIQVDEIKKHLPVLNSIPVWITRECYKKPKPDPDGYQTALKLLGKKGDKTIGFEDSMRGLCALLAAGVDKAVLICPSDHPQRQGEIPKDVDCFSSFLDSGR